MHFVQQQFKISSSSIVCFISGFWLLGIAIFEIDFFSKFISSERERRKGEERRELGTLSRALTPQPSLSLPWFWHTFTHAVCAWGDVAV